MLWNKAGVLLAVALDERVGAGDDSAAGFSDRISVADELLRGPGVSPYYVVRPGDGLSQTVERLSPTGRRVLRADGMGDSEIAAGLETGALRYVTHTEVLETLDRSRCGLVITGGGDCAGIGDCLAAFGEGLDNQLAMLGVRNAGAGLIVAPDDFRQQLVVADPLLLRDLRGQSSTPFGSARIDPLKSARENALVNMAGHKFLAGTGGNDHLGLLERIARELSDMVVVGTFKSIDGDGCIGDRPAQMLGFATARDRTQRDIWDIAQSAASHREITVVEVFGRHCGKLAFEAGRRDPDNFAGLDGETKRKLEEYGDSVMILVPERPTSLKSIADEVARIKKDFGSCVVVVAEGFMPPEMNDEIKRFAVDEELKREWGNRRRLECIHMLITRAGDSGGCLAKLLEDHELAIKFAKMVWESEKDSFGNVAKVAGMREFVMAAIKVLVGIKKVNQTVINYQARGAAPNGYDILMGQKIGAMMAGLVNDGVKGGRAVVYFEGMDAMREAPIVVPLVGVSAKNDLNNPDLYPDDKLRRGGVFWEQ